MRCPACRELNRDRVIDSRATESGVAIRRRRVCEACNRRFTTKERIEEEVRLSVIKRDGTRIPYRRDKVVSGLRHACYKLAINDDQLEQIADLVEEDLFREHDRQVSSEQLGLYVSSHLRTVNQVAYVRFMAVYRQFADVAEFINAIDDVRELDAEDIPSQQALFGQ